MNLFWVKKILAGVLYAIGADMPMLRRINDGLENNYVRIINYHSTPAETADMFERQLVWYKSQFQNVDKSTLEKFIVGESSFRHSPGILVTFDDGYSDNYTVAKGLLEKHGFTGCFFVSSDLVGTEGYMTWEQLRDLLANGHIIGCHTATHWRMNPNDTEERLCAEIIESRKKLESNLGQEIDWFAWCGGEEEHYTIPAAKKIKEAGYKCSFLTMGEPVKQGVDRLQLERTNVESSWSMALVQFQLCGWIDIKVTPKRRRVESLIKL